MSSSDNKRITKNAAFLCLRMLIVMFVNLYTSRVVLASLGVSDYGVYNVVGGLASSFFFFSTALPGCTQRFLNFELGRGSVKGANDVFNISLLVFCILAVAVMIAGCVIGRWFVLNKLVIPAQQLDAAVQVLYITVLSFSLIFVFSTVEAVFMAREDMKLYAYLGVIEVFIKLGIAYAISMASDKLVLYAWLMLAAQMIPKIILSVNCLRRYPEAKIRYFWDKKLFKSLMKFTGWDMYAGVAYVLTDQALNITVNIFFGPVVNAARGIAAQVNSAINNFNSYIFMAVRPQLIKQYAAGEYESLKRLVMSSTRMSYYLLWLLSLPIILRSDYVLGLWLENVPEYASVFVKWILIYTLVNSISNPIWTTVHATGELKRPVICGSNFLLLVSPVAYLAIKSGMSPEVTYPLFTLGRLAYILVSLRFMSVKISMSIGIYLSKAIMPILLVTALSGLINIQLDRYIPDSFAGLVVFAAIATIVNLTFIYTLGITRAEKDFFIGRIVTAYSRLRGM